MFRTRSLLSAALLCAVFTPAWAQAQAPEGNWLVSYIQGSFEVSVGIVKLQSRGGMVAGELVAGSPRVKDTTLQSASMEGKTLRFVFKAPAGEMTFEFTPAAGAKRALGTMATDTNVYPATAATTMQTEIDTKSVSRAIDCPPLTQARALSQKGLLLNLQANSAKEPEKKKALLQQAAEANLNAKKETPKLYREVLAKYADSPVTLEAAVALIRGAAQNGAMPDEIKGWANTAATAAKQYGPRWHAEVAGQLAALIVNQEGLAALAVDLAKQAEAQLSPKTPVATQSKTLTLLAQALRKNGQDGDAKAIEGKLSKLEEELDREYLAKVPPFKGAPFAGRQSKSDRAVFMELFTGATCPPCVAADVAFDVLAKNYKSKDLVLIQYHMHIPGPDPMTNPDTEARWDYYRKAFPGEVRGVPSSVFNGKPTAGGGGGMANAEKKYETYCQVINPLLEQPATVKLRAQAIRKGNNIDINVQVADLVNPSSEKKLRILLVEETIRFAGSNKIRFHHHVVRAMPGAGAEGVALTGANHAQTAKVDLDSLRTSLNKYLDNYHATVRPLPSPHRPLDFTNLRVVAFVQDDATKEILQATQVEVEGK